LHLISLGLACKKWLIAVHSVAKENIEPVGNQQILSFKTKRTLPKKDETVRLGSITVFGLLYKNPFPDLGGIGQITYAGVSTYNSLQTKVEKRYSNGLSFLATYTWSHALDDASDAGGNFGAIGSRNQALIPFIDEYSNSVYDVRHRFTINGNYEIPVGKGRRWLNNSKLVDETIGNWATSLTWVAQTGTPYSISPNISTAAGGGARAYIVGNPNAGGGAPNSTNPGITCPSEGSYEGELVQPVRSG
jgi:hypothetical protein